MSNPYQSSADPVEESRRARGATRTRISWFVIGFVFSWCTWALVAYYFNRPRDFSAPSSDVSKGPDWLKRARKCSLGGFTLIVPADSSGEEALIFPSKEGYPVTLYSAADDRSRTNRVGVEDSEHRKVRVNDFNADGRFDAMSFSTGAHFDNVTFHDHNLDGQYDQRLGPGLESAVQFDGQLREVVTRTGTTAQIELNGVLTELRFVDGIWEIDDSKQ